MYSIVFIENCKPVGEYSGSTYVFQGERFACFDERNPKLYKSEKTAINSAEKLLKSCVNTGDDYEIYVNEKF